jgi:hypothetical protein
MVQYVFDIVSASRTDRPIAVDYCKYGMPGARKDLDYGNKPSVVCFGKLGSIYDMTLFGRCAFHGWLFDICVDHRLVDS